MIKRAVEEALDLTGMQVDGENSIDARDLEHVRNQLRGDWLSARRLSVLAGVAVIRNDCGNALC